MHYLAPTVIFWLSALAIFQCYLGYFIFLKLLLKMRGPLAGLPDEVDDDSFPSISVIIAACDEEKTIEKRIANIFESDYPAEKMEVVVGSDGSTDRTVELAEKSGDPRVRVQDHKERRGRALVHNDAVGFARNQVMVFTDAETTFEKDFLRIVCSHFSNPKVGCVVGRIKFKNTAGDSVTSSEGFYWRFEVALRKRESDLRILATGTGACMAVRKSVYRPLEATEDVDFITPIDCVGQNMLVVYEPRAVATDRLPSDSVERQMEARIRMTAKNFRGTVKKLTPVFAFRHPLEFFSIVSHKILRWTCPFFALALLFSSIFLSVQGVAWAEAALIIQGVFYLLCAADALPIESRALKLCRSFFFANYCFMIGVIQGVAGRQPAKYR
ncbi:MAG: glycosyltransferase [Candidatus Omnitrophota bacterium]